MPAPERIGDRRLETRVLDVPKMIIGHYTDLEVDALLEGYATKEDVAGLGGGAGDLSAYATTEYVDAAVAGVSTTPPDLSDYYTKPEVDQALANVATGGTVDLGGYATTQYVDDAITAIPAPDLLAYAKLTDPDQIVKARLLDARGLWLRPFPDPGTGVVGAVGVTDLGKGLRLGVTYDGKEPTQLAWTTDLDAYYTKPQTDAAIKAAAEQSALDLDAVQSQLVFAIEETGKQTHEKIDLKADKATTYTKDEVDAALAALPDQVTAHAGPIPQPTAVTPSGLEDAYKDIADGLHYYPEAASLISVIRQEFQTTIVVQGPSRSIARIVKSSTGQPTTQNPSTLVTCDPDGKWMRLTSAELDQPFSNPQTVDIFSPTGGGSADLSAYAKLNDPNQAIVTKTVESAKFSFAPDKSIVSLVSGDSERPVYRAGTKNFALAFTTELQGLAKVTDLDQVLTTKSVIAQGFAFDQQNVIKIHDTGEGYGPRLTFITASGNDVQVEPIVLKSDLEPLNAILPRVESLESKSSPAVDLDGYATKPELDFQAKRVDAVIDAAGITMDKVLALQAASPTSAADINDPALAEFRKSVLDEVKKMMAGGKVVPPDIGWTVCPNSNNGVFAKCLNGVVHLRGVLLKGLASGWTANAFQLPAEIPAPPREMVVPTAAKNSTSRVYSYATLAVDRKVGISGDASMNNVWFDCISYPAYD
jgi:hypothetical protein